MRKVLSIVLVALFVITLSPQLAKATNPPGNLVRNPLFDQDWIGVGGPNIVPVYWAPFVVDGNPEFGRHGFEMGLQLKSDGPAFTGGVYQEVNGTTLGATYFAHIGTAAKWGAMDSGRLDGHIGRTIGIDPFGGTDPRSPNVVWGSQVWSDAHWAWIDYDNVFDAPNVSVVAQNTKVTVFLKVMYPNGGLSAHTWLYEAVVALDPSKPIQLSQLTASRATMTR